MKNIFFKKVIKKTKALAFKVAKVFKKYAIVALKNAKSFRLKKAMDLSYFSEKKKSLTIRATALLLCSLLIIPATFLQTRNSSAEDELNVNTSYTGAHGSSYVVTLLSEVKDENFLEKEALTFNQDYIDGKEEKEKAEAEAAKKKAEEEKKKKEAESKKNGTYKAPPAAPADGFVQYDVPLSYEWQVYTYNLCQKYNVSYEVMLGLMYAESTFRFNCSSGVAFGICQIHYCHEEYAKSIGIKNYKEPEGNILLGVKFLSGHLKAQNGDYHKALICYNYGSGGAKKYCFNKGIYQTAYSKKVMAYAHNLKPVS